MWGDSGTTANWTGVCSGTCSCPNCGYTFYSRPRYYTSTASNGYDSYSRAVREFTEAAKKNPKWRIWHRSAIVPRSFDRLPPFANACVRPMVLASSASSTSQRRRHKRRLWQRQLRRALNSNAAQGGK